MSCNCGRGSAVAYRVTFDNGGEQDYATLSEAQHAGEASGATYTIKAVPK